MSDPGDRSANDPSGPEPRLKSRLQALGRRVRGFDHPAAEVDLREADPRTYGVPQRSTRVGPAQAAWDRAFGQPLTFRSFEFSPDFVDFRELRLELPTAPTMPSRFETSRNWAGAYITANQGRHFGQVWGFWRIPAKLAVPPPPFSGDPALPYLAVHWIGLDGQRDYLDASLPQLGTQAALDPQSGTITATTWFQWWAPNDVGIVGPLPIGLDASPGDRIGAVLTAIGPHTVWAVMVNLSTFQATSLWHDAPFVRVPSGAEVQPAIEGATAEWVVERSQILGENTQNNLPDYGETKFELCVAVEASQTNALSVLDGIPQVLSGARYIRMYEVLPDPARTAYLSMPHKVDDVTLRVTFGGF